MVAGACTVYWAVSWLGLRVAPLPLHDSTVMSIVIVEILVAPLQSGETPGSEPLKYIELPLTVSGCDAPQ